MLGVEILVLPTKREDDGLAMSSRNAFLSPEERRAARAVPRALEAAKAALDRGERDPAAILGAARSVIAGERLLSVDYLELVDPEKLEPVEKAAGEMLLAVAVFDGATRLIDNIVLRS
jgi:pantoate--beta-alanine ligase